MVTPTIELPQVNSKVINPRTIEVHVYVTPWPGVRAGAGTEDYLFLVPSDGRAYTPRVKAWLDLQFPQGYEINQMWVPEPVCEYFDEF